MHATATKATAQADTAQPESAGKKTAVTPTPRQIPLWANATVPAIQFSLKVNNPGDKYEREADRVAEQVMRMPEPHVQHRCTCAGGTEPDGECLACDEKRLGVQRQVEDDEEEEEEMVIRTKRVVPSDTGATATSPPGVFQVLKSPGRPLDAATRAYMEQRFGADFSQVRVHTNVKAAKSADEINALAYTSGRNVVFGAGQYSPATLHGRQLLAHELTHVIQQSAHDTGIGKMNPTHKIEGQAKQHTIQRKIFFRSVSQAGFWHWPPYEEIESLREITDHEVQTYKADIGVGVHDFDDIIAATGTEYEIVGGPGQSGRDYRTRLIRGIVQNMHDSADDLYYDSYPEAVSEIRKRALLSLRMRVTQGRSPRERPTGYPPACERDPGPRVGELAGDYWNVHEPSGSSYYFTLTNAGEADPYEALRTLLFVHRRDPCLRTLMHCDYMITALQFITMADSMGRANFTRAVQSGDIDLRLTWDGFVRVTASGGDTENRSLRVVYINSEDDFIIGDHVIFYNHEAYNDLNQVQHQSWRLENAIVIDNEGTRGSRRFQGHGFFSPQTREHFVDAMVSKINVLANKALGHVSRNNRAGLRTDFEFTRNGITFNPIVYDFEGGRIQNARIQYHEGGLWDNSDMSNTIRSMPLRRFTPSDFPTPFVKPGQTRIRVRRPIESIRQSL